MKRIKWLLYSATLIPATSLAQSRIGTGVNDSAPTNDNGDKIGPQSAIVWLDTFTSALLFFAGAIAVVIIIFGGVRYVTSTGDAMRVKQAKDTILYGVIGLIVSILAFAIVQFIIQNID